MTNATIHAAEEAKPAVYSPPAAPEKSAPSPEKPVEKNTSSK